MQNSKHMIHRKMLMNRGRVYLTGQIYTATPIPDDMHSVGYSNMLIR
ncbi:MULTISPECIES: hypothetical protein [Mammaliicoccus]|jgi:hypothetical protein|uniref:RidA family protein n=1 Tax=Mammaliicoccus sciuri TaxID=1296 RepID=A0AAW5LNU3_MAMSC|nr:MULTISPECIES: hypothetical protein [Mammaliicoccus]MBA1397140.1 hypothetical protein [Mammaliicoccus sciuri]MBF0719046.1 hypothetical protein [Mammaliicoccus sciuri]MBG9206140.1 hypothetical protein [Mammaliicoccus sciuri]MBG9210571.1 hypothetical protein [Mammaliicoccus sciuri]MBO1207698.1 hypothetical protein [Mammaliicoccus sciuri]